MLLHFNVLHHINKSHFLKKDAASPPNLWLLVIKDAADVNSACSATPSKRTANESPKTNSNEIVIDQTIDTGDIVQCTAHLGQTNLFH
jgi:hypothetical protein